MHKIIRLAEVIQTTGLARSTIYKMMSEKVFPSSISLGPKSVGWLEADIQQWIEERRGLSSTIAKGVIYE